MAESFVFYKSFIECVRMYDRSEQLDLLDDLIDSAIYDKDPDSPAVFMMMQNVAAAHNRYEKAVENGTKGGRPKYIEPEEWQAFYAEHTQKETAEHFNVSIDTLQRWIKSTKYKKPQNTAKPQNLTDTVTDTYTVTDTVTVTDISINNKKTPARCALPAPAGFIKDGERIIGEPYEMGGEYYVTVEKADGERVERRGWTS